LEHLRSIKFESQENKIKSIEENIGWIRRIQIMLEFKIRSQLRIGKNTDNNIGYQSRKTSNANDQYLKANLTHKAAWKQRFGNKSVKNVYKKWNIL